MTPGAAAAWGSVVVAGVIDLAVINRKKDSITSACQRNPAVTAAVLTVFVLHLAEPAWFKPLDPFLATGRLASRVHSAVRDGKS